jgi:hypothetical protein
VDWVFGKIRYLLFFVSVVLFVVKSPHRTNIGFEQLLIMDRIWKLFSLNHGDFVLE